MAKFIIWGTGKLAIRNYKFVKKIPMLKSMEIVAFVDNDSQKWGDKIDGIPIISPSEITDTSYDYISVWSTYQEEITKQLEGELGISSEKQKNLLEPFFNSLKDKYAGRQNKEIEEFIEKLEERGSLHIYQFPVTSKTQLISNLYEAFYDEEAGLYYIIFENKRMYYRRGFNFIEENGKKYVKNPWFEQNPNSPHLYEGDEIRVCDGDIIVDAGACEGNFSLHHVERASKIFLLECKPDWVEALEHTFAPYKDKVVVCNKFLSDKDSEDTITLDTLLKGEKVSFIKMDIEGEEINALHGANNVLKNNKGLKMAICSYHRHGDEERIKEILHSNHMKTETSKGYMLFLYDEDVLRNPELRRGIVRAIADEN